MKGTRATAESRAIRAINDWLQAQRTGNGFDLDLLPCGGAR